ncbi:Ni2+-Co2+ transporter (NiCoT) family protein [Yersinia nurmii]|uniref:Nickel/cobalt efflux system n=1 Tax=Yersinia nurmii TaxID=685706 RepID=A0ABM9SMV9_9GAMM|nr:nickel transporter [Yersinia nurmii]CNF20904.1 Ni2+-Co2+ transporter (NiCoT) family protein [Yersinia nurmii]
MIANIKLTRTSATGATLTALLMIALVATFIWHWSDFVQYCINLQIYMHRYLVMYLLQQQNNQSGAGLMLILFSFTYGFLHAVGPGHGKFVITTYLSTNREKANTSRLITFLGSMMQGVVATLFVLILAVFFNLSMGDLSLSRYFVEKGSAVFIMLFGVVLMLRAAGINLFHLYKKEKRLAIHQIATFPTSGINKLPLAPHDSHQLADCGCGHKHLPAAEELTGGWKNYFWIIASIGIRPCSGAILILVFANAVGMFTWGVIAAMSMALGTSLSIMIVATLVYHAREKFISSHGQLLAGKLIHVSRIATVIGGLILILFGLVLFSSVIPINASGDFIAAGC